MRHHQVPQETAVFSSFSLMKVFIGVVGLFATSQVAIPLQPVPMTFQTFSMLLIGLTYRPSEAFFSFLGWLFLGALGFPVFANYLGGVQLLLGPTGGYLLGLWVAAVAMAWLCEKIKTKTFKTLIFIACAGQAILFGLGVSRLSCFVGWSQAFATGLAPFILWNPLKTGLAVLCARGLLLKRS
jgi:biotin transport system substrate-specific component